MTRTVKGPTDHVVVVGAGLGGLSAALRLAGAGRKVTVIERESVPGGRNGLLNKDGYSFDTGPTVLTMPSLIQDAFSCVGEDMKDWLELMPLSPLYRAFYADGSQIDVHANTAQMEQEIREKVSPEEALGYRRYVDFVTKLYKYEMHDFIDKNIDSPLNLLTPNLARLIALGGFRHLQPKVNQYLKDPRLQKVYSFQAMYAGVSPQQALAIYAVIAYMDSVNGVFFPKGGMHAVPRALAAAAQKHGVEFKYNTTVTGLDKQNGRVKAVTTNTGERIECDVVVMNPDLPVVWRDLLGKTQLCSLVHRRSTTTLLTTIFTSVNPGMASLTNSSTRRF
jgi:phytoene desaturase